MTQAIVPYQKIGIVGPESVGKSVLAFQLAEHFSGSVVKEFARDYVERLQRPYTYEDVCMIAEQNRKEAQKGSLSSHHTPVFYDTELIVTKVWLDEVYGRRPDWLNSPIPEDCMMDCYLLLAPDLPWQADIVRENGDERRRQELFELYRKEIALTRRPFFIICGQGTERLNNAIKAITQH